MGAESRVDVLAGKSLDDAFHRAQQDARYEYGSSYTGSIAEATGYRMAAAAPMLEWSAVRTAEQLLAKGTVQKWGPAVVVPIAEPTGVRTITMTVDVTADPAARGGYFSSYSPSDIVVAAVEAELRAGEGIVSIEQRMGETETKVVLTTTSGPSKTVYRVRGGEREVWDLPTMAEAKAQALRAAERGWAPKYSITRVSLRESGEPLAVAERVVTKKTVEVTATLGRPLKKAPAKWAVAGIYSC